MSLLPPFTSYAVFWVCFFFFVLTFYSPDPTETAGDFVLLLQESAKQAANAKAQDCHFCPFDLTIYRDSVGSGSADEREDLR